MLTEPAPRRSTGRTVLCPVKVELRSFLGDICIWILHVVIDATDSFSCGRTLRTSASGWFEQRCPFIRVFTYKQKHRDGTKQLYRVRPTRVPTRRRRSLLSFQGNWETSRPRNLSVSASFFQSRVIMNVYAALGFYGRVRDEHASYRSWRCWAGRPDFCVIVDPGSRPKSLVQSQ